MGFDSGTQAFIVCTMDREIPDDYLSRFSEKKALPFTGLMDEPQTGWVSGRHLLETRLAEETVNFGGYLHMHLRTAVRKIPSSLYKAECRIEELALMQATNSWVLSRKQKKEIREDVKERLLKEMPPSISGIPFVYDKTQNLLYLGATSLKQIDSFLVHFYDCLGFEPKPMYPSFLYEDITGLVTDDLDPLRFTPNRDKHDDELLLGRDFLMWLWYRMEQSDARVDHEEYGFFSWMIDGPLQFAGVEPEEGESVIRKGLPTVSAEARASIFAGKKLTRAKIRLVRDRDEWQFTLDADSFTFRGMKLPDGEELDPLSHFQERMMFFEIFRSVFRRLYSDFINDLRLPERRKKLEEDLIQWVESMDKL